MMFDKKLFFSVCEKYGVGMSTTTIHPMIKDRDEVHIIIDDDISKIFLTHTTYFEE